MEKTESAHKRIAIEKSANLRCLLSRLLLLILIFNPKCLPHRGLIWC
jgi:hypothetical protein